MPITSSQNQNNIRRSSSNCIRTKCPQKCCNAYGNCINTLSEDPRIYQCKYYYDHERPEPQIMQITSNQFIQDPVVIFCLVIVFVIFMVLWKLFLTKKKRMVVFTECHKIERRNILKQSQKNLPKLHQDSQNSHKEIVGVQLSDNIRQKTKNEDINFETNAAQKKICVSLEDCAIQKEQINKSNIFVNIINNPENNEDEK